MVMKIGSHLKITVLRVFEMEGGLHFLKITVFRVSEIQICFYQGYEGCQYPIKTIPFELNIYITNVLFELYVCYFGRKDFIYLLSRGLLLKKLRVKLTNSGVTSPFVHTHLTTYETSIINIPTYSPLFRNTRILPSKVERIKRCYV